MGEMFKGDFIQEIQPLHMVQDFKHNHCNFLGHTHIHMYMYTDAQTHPHTHILSHTHIHTRSHTHASTRTLFLTHLYTHAHTHSQNLVQSETIQETPYLPPLVVSTLQFYVGEPSTKLTIIVPETLLNLHLL